MRLGFIVEGFNDEKLVWQVFPSATVVVTKGTRFNNRVRMDIKDALMVCDAMFLLTDPDRPGDLLANTILSEFPMLKRINLDAEQCKCYRNNRLKIGIEHAHPAYLLGEVRKHLQDCTYGSAYY